MKLHITHCWQYYFNSNIYVCFFIGYKVSFYMLLFNSKSSWETVKKKKIISNLYILMQKFPKFLSQRMWEHEKTLGTSIIVLCHYSLMGCRIFLWIFPRQWAFTTFVHSSVRLKCFWASLLMDDVIFVVFFVVKHKIVIMFLKINF